MLTYSQQQSDMLDDIFSALSHPVRRAIIERVAEGDCSASELADPHQMSRSAISLHLKILLETNLIEREKRGKYRIYSLNVKPLSFAFSWIVRYRIFWETFLDEIQEKVGKEYEEVRENRK